MLGNVVVEYTGRTSDKKHRDKRIRRGRIGRVKRRRILLILAGMIIAAVLVMVLWPAEKEPEYQGKKLSAWIIAYSPLQDTNSPSANALRHIGTNALPLLVKWVGFERPAWRTRLLAAYGKLPVPLQNNTAKEWLNQYAKETRAWAATSAFRVMGPDTLSAIPSLAPYLNEPRMSVRRERSLIALVNIGVAIRESGASADGDRLLNELKTILRTNRFEVL